MPGTSDARTGRGADGPDSRHEGRSSRAARANEPGWPYPDPPSWPAGSTGRPFTPDHPSWPASDVGRPIGYGRHDETAPQLPYGDHPSWPAAGPGGSVAAGAARSPADGGPPQRDPAGEPLTPTMHHDPYPEPGWAAGPSPRAGGMLQLAAPGATGPPVSWNTGDYGNADSVRVAERVLADADQQAAAIRQEASSQAVAIREAAEREGAEIRRQTAADAVPIREGAEREAAEIRQLAEAQAAAIREAAEREAAELRADLAAMAAEMSRVAAYVTENLTSPGLPAVSPPRRAGPRPLTIPVELPHEPGVGPTEQPPARPAAAPRTRPRTRPAAKPAARPAAKPKTRQYKAMRLTSVAAAALVVFAAAAGSTEVGLHGFKFFVFRSAGTGATNGDGLQEDQGPGQPGAPGAHHKAQHQQTAKAKAHGKAHHQHAKAHRQHRRAHQAKPARQEKQN